ncbi:dihydrofolate reductase family protein [Chitinophaga horti]|uniref:Dihydrofolate reductase family protein n=1 Tax=Chitinophaga horti TaxID=2920382 RepID=A0ABY6IY75_9BACT|nr:dihydrofolate reductase family protein [Chitinophaga horti]UYQ92343.1 dihydrofolate reductase family protein [Chitinophaga horti]
MRRIIYQATVSLDGFFEGPGHELDWHIVDEQFNKCAVQLLNSVDTLIFGRVTYELMAGYWPTWHSQHSDATVAHKMNNLQKLVFSNSLQSVDWKNAVLVRESAAEILQRLKSLPGGDMAILGSSQLAASLLSHHLIDEFRLTLSPVVLGKGNTLFNGLLEQYKLTLTRARMFRSGNVLLTYRPADKPHQLTLRYSAAARRNA